MDGALLAAAAAAEPEPDAEAILDFLYLCPQGLAEVDATGAIRLINPACMQLLLRTGAEAPQLDNLFTALAPLLPGLADRVRDDQRRRGVLLDAVRLHVDRPQRSGPPGRSTAAAAEPVVLALTLVRIRPERLMVLLSDVSQQVAQERRLRETEAWFTAVVQDEQRYGFMKLDADGLVTQWDESAVAMFAVAAADTLRHPAGPLLAEGGTGSEDLARRLAIARRDGWQVAAGWLPRGDGSRFWGTSVIAVLQGADPEPGSDAFVVVVRDGTDQRASVEALRQALSVDHLTGVLNRRCFHELAEAACEQAGRAGLALAAIMVDADHFKRVNDRWGHAGGDAVLAAIGTALTRGVRVGQDHVGRLGGEEFAILLPGLDATQAALLAERLRQALADLTVAIPTAGGGTARITASFGVAELGPDVPNLEALLRAADAALYAAKAAGRNRVVATQGERRAA